MATTTTWIDDPRATRWQRIYEDLVTAQQAALERGNYDEVGRLNPLITKARRYYVRWHAPATQPRREAEERRFRQTTRLRWQNGAVSTLAGRIERKPDRRPMPVACERSAMRRPRERRAGTPKQARAPGGDDPPGLPRGVDTDLNVVWAEARGRFETSEEYRTLARLAVIKARELRRWAA